MKTLILVILMTSLSAFAACENDDVKIQANISAAALDESYTEGFAVLKDFNSNVEVTLKATNQNFVLDYVLFENDGAGNFTLSTIAAQEVPTLYIDHDHETWHTDGLWGYLAMNNETEFTFEKMTDCSFDDLFIIK